MRFLAVVAAVLVATIASHAAAADDASSPPDTTTVATENPFLPDDEDVGDCLSSLPPPDCGSEEKGGTAQLLAFAAVLLGMAFIGWRIARGVRRRDREMSPDP